MSMAKQRAKAGALVAAALATAGVLAACSGSSGNDNGSTPTPSATTPAAPSQAVTINPSHNLTDGQKVTVTATGYTAGQSYSVVECGNKGAATGAGDCDLAGIKVFKADANGTVNAQYKVAAGPFGQNQIDCTKAPGCILSVANAGSAAPTEVATGRLYFAKS